MILSAHPGIIAEQNLQGKLYPMKTYKLAKQTRKGGAARKRDTVEALWPLSGPPTRQPDLII